MAKKSARRPVTKGHLIGVAIGIVVGIFLGRGNVGPGDILLGFLAFYVSNMVGVILHELGHAWGARSVGGIVHLIQLGKPNPKTKPRNLPLLGFPCLLNSLPFSGVTHLSFKSADHFRTRLGWIIISGPLINLLLLGLGLSCWHLWPDPEYRPLWVGWCLSQGFLFLIAIIPLHLKIVGQLRANDGMLLIKTLRYSDKEIARTMKLFAFAQKLDYPYLYSKSFDELKARHEESPSEIGPLYRLATGLVESNDLQFAPYMLKLLDHPDFPQEGAVQFIDTYLTLQLNEAPPTDKEQADRLSRQLLAQSDTLTAKGTRGSVLVDLGHPAEGREILTEVLKKTKSPVDKLYAHVFLALAAQAEGLPEVALKHAIRAKKLKPSAPVLARISGLLTA